MNADPGYAAFTASFAQPEEVPSLSMLSTFQTVAEPSPLRGPATNWALAWLGGAVIVCLILTQV